VDPKHIVAEGYDRIGERYVRWADQIRVEERERYTRLLLDRLPANAEVMELGCGAGVPTTKRLAERFSVTAADISERQIERARLNVPGARFIKADMAALDFAENSFDAVTAFYSITHVPRTQHAALLQSIARWLRPGGLFVVSLGTGDSEGVEEDWLGAPMYFSHFDTRANRVLVQTAGLQTLRAEVETAEEDGRPASFLWVVARKPQ
jgi:ubiquinone/menaquinone biosynthesis C-methylase UbiE